MKLRHAAAVALVGWYLMVPPRDGAAVAIHAPFDRWKIEGSYDSARECQKEFDVFLSAPLFPGQNADRTARSTDSKTDEIYAEDRQWWNAICIATDDPRLAM